jgi:hypothetical protein
MPEVSLYVAVITAAAGVVGAAIPQVTIVLRDVRQAERDRRDRSADALRQACLSLLGSAGSLRTQVMDAVEYRGARMGDLLTEIRRCAAEVQLHAASVELLAPKTLAEPADQLAKAAERFAVAAVTGTDPTGRQIVRPPVAAELAQAMDFFRKQAVAEARA